eukprot:6490602-Prymnesium_polylepis.1
MERPREAARGRERPREAAGSRQFAIERLAPKDWHAPGSMQNFWRTFGRGSRRRVRSAHTKNSKKENRH